MKTVRYLVAAAALLAAAACSQADGITTPRTPAAPRMDGAFMGSGGFTAPAEPDGVTSEGTGSSLPPMPGDTTNNDAPGRGGGFIGSGG